MLPEDQPTGCLLVLSMPLSLPASREVFLLLLSLPLCLSLSLSLAPSLSQVLSRENDVTAAAALARSASLTLVEGRRCCARRIGGEGKRVDDFECKCMCARSQAPEPGATSVSLCIQAACDHMCGSRVQASTRKETERKGTQKPFDAREHMIALSPPLALLSPLDPPPVEEWAREPATRAPVSLCFTECVSLHPSTVLRTVYVKQALVSRSRGCSRERSHGSGKSENEERERETAAPSSPAAAAAAAVADALLPLISLFRPLAPSLSCRA